MSRNKQTKLAKLAFRFVLTIGIVNLFADFTYEGARRYCPLNFRRNKISDSDKMNPPFVIWLINDRLDANRLFPHSESRFHHFPITASSVQMSSHSKV
jgi:hypothetical protein